MKKKKTAAYALAALLLVGGTFTGTKAWFTHNATHSADLVITTGNVDVTVDSTGWFMVDSEGKPVEGSGNENGGYNAFENIKPGDRFMKRVVIRNTGSLDQVLSISGGEIKDNDVFNIVSEHTNLLNKDITLEQGDFTSFDIAVEVKEEYTGENLKLQLSDYMGDIKVDATQTKIKR